MNITCFILVFAVLAASATLYPPFKWGEEKIEIYLHLGERERRYQGREYTYIPKLPVKAYDFLFNADKRDFQLGWGWNETTHQSTQDIYSLQRKLSVSDLILEYVLAFLIALVVSALVGWIWPKRREAQG